ncbi:Vacuolar protein-sorting-associated protein 28 [Pichia californica]|uniref:Vacuolar protein-sorting-associated protein 28 n=1 Tax=Pichia californica TaxID=460514 RepID=A0A9P7BHL3_9ASCO|nr:Vacuolar protein-sorting-associated protein 28 [[Candida] californica]
MEYSYKNSVISVPQYINSTDRENNDLISELYSILFTINSIEKIFIKSNFKKDFEKNEYLNSIDNLLLQWNSIIESLNIENNKDDNFNFLNIFNPYFETSEIETLKFGLRRIKIGINGFKEKEQDYELKEKEKEKEKEQTNQEENKLELQNSTDNSLLKTSSSSSLNITTIDNKGKKAIAEATSAFITLMDAIKLNYDTKDTLHPLFSDVLTKSGKISTDFENRNKLVSWLIKINKMPLFETFDETQLKEMLWDVDSAYNGFFNQL